MNSTPHTLPVFTPRHGPGDDGVHDVTVGGARAGYIRPYGTGWLAVADLDPIHYSRHYEHEIDAFAVFYTLPQVGWCLPCAQGRHPVTGVCGRVGSAGVCRCSCWADPSDGRDRYELSRMIDPDPDADPLAELAVLFPELAVPPSMSHELAACLVRVVRAMEAGDSAVIDAVHAIVDGGVL